MRIVCREAALDQLLLRLATFELDVVLSDAPIHPTAKIRAYNHLLGECAVAFVATADVAEGLHHRFPKSLNGSPMLLPTNNTNFRRNLDSWFESEGIRPDIIGEFEDYALLRTFGHAGGGVFPVPAIFEKQLRREDGLKRIGSTDKVRTFFYAILRERKIEHPAVVAMCDTARRQLFGEGKSFSKLPVILGGARNRGAGR